MKKGLTELVIIIDRSGSMSPLADDVVGGFNSLIKAQRKEEGETLVTTIFFNDKEKLIHQRSPINQIKELTSYDYRPSGCTALLDAIGNAIASLNEVHSHLKDEELPEHVIFSIMTDGLENSSVEYSYKAVHDLIEKHKKAGWDFIFQAANIDAIAEGNKIGINIDDVGNFAGTPMGVKMCFYQTESAIRRKRKTPKDADVDIDVKKSSK